MMRPDHSPRAIALRQGHSCALSHGSSINTFTRLCRAQARSMTVCRRVHCDCLSSVPRMPTPSRAGADTTHAHAARFALMPLDDASGDEASSLWYSRSDAGACQCPPGEIIDPLVSAWCAHLLEGVLRLHTHGNVRTPGGKRFVARTVAVQSGGRR